VAKLPADGGDLTVGLEEEVFLVDRASFDLLPCAGELIAALGGDSRFKLELPAAQLEILTEPGTRVGDAVVALEAGRRALIAETGSRAAAIGCGAHPFTASEGELNQGERHLRIARDYRMVARRQLVCALHVHVAVSGPDRSLAVYNALRSHLPDIAALAANAPLLDGRDTGLASVRPVISSMLPRQGVPPPLSSWEGFAEELAWGARAGRVPDPGSWWWELRPNLVQGTIEIRVADSQITTSDTAGVAAFVHSLVGWLAQRHEAGEALPVDEGWRIGENRWSACADGVQGTMADLTSGAVEPTSARLQRLIEQLAPVAEGLGCLAELDHAAGMCGENGAVRQRRVAEDRGPHALAAWLVDEFTPSARASPA
jgi:carboxylate-amine ligase